MNLYEYQSKELLAQYGLNIPKGITLSDVNGVENALKEIGDNCVVKAQVHAGSRAMAGGIKFALNAVDAKIFTEQLLHNKIITPQTEKEGLLAKSVLLEEAIDFERSFYASLIVDRSTQSVVLMVSRDNVDDIEKTAKEHPESIVKKTIDINTGLSKKVLGEIVSVLGIEEEYQDSFSQQLQNMFSLFKEKDLLLLEINPLVLAKDGKFYCLDAKVEVDDSALYRQPYVLSLIQQNNASEKITDDPDFNFSYVELDGVIGCMANGAGLAMGTMDLLINNGLKPANFLDLSGAVTNNKVSNALGRIYQNKKVEVIFINIFGGIVHCDIVAEGVIDTIKQKNIDKPIFLRFAGTMAEEGIKKIKDSGLNIFIGSDTGSIIKEIKNII
ncbi:MAG: ADP-forming succinate--CoA ligase subunit beta [Candidatus Pacebacteria bacterium]|nr:ADP-forming succinate--CoA ligase subunit beta [Candidatus Paceibacterota bacterium]